MQPLVTWKQLGTWIFAVGAMLFAHAVHATEQRNYSKLIGDARTSITSAKVVIVDANVMFPYALDEGELNRMGCSFTPTSKAEIDSLVQILVDANISEAPPFFLGGKRGISARLGIYLTAESGAIKLIFASPTDKPRAEYGWADDLVSVRAMNEQFAIELRKWAAARTPIATPLCARNKSSPTP
ncbi:MAG: hypothetical protein V4693_10465 [Pseudomonadota bacterium]